MLVIIGVDFSRNFEQCVETVNSKQQGWNGFGWSQSVYPGGICKDTRAMLMIIRVDFSCNFQQWRHTINTKQQRWDEFRWSQSVYPGGIWNDTIYMFVVIGVDFRAIFNSRGTPFARSSNVRTIFDGRKVFIPAGC